MLQEIIKITNNFANREKELNELKTTLAAFQKQKPRHLVIAGARRLGKTYLLYKHIQESISPTIVPVYIDVLYKRNWSDVCDDIIESLMENYTFCTKKKLRVERFNTWFTGTLQDIIKRLTTIEVEMGTATGAYLKLRASIKEKPDDEIELVQTTMNAVEEFAEKKNICIIIILDEFQHIEKFNHMTETLAAMRSTIQFQKQVQYIFSGSSTTFINKIFVASTSAFWRQVEIYKLAPFTLEATMKLARSYNITLDKEGGAILTTITKGIPDYIVKTLLELPTRKKPLKEDIPRSFQKTVDRESLLFSDIFEHLPSLQQQVMILLAEGKTQYKQLEQEIGKKVGGILNQMVNAQVIERTEKGRYDIFDPVFKESVKNRLSL
jgi:AAA+ ATPase superfamily predicted ATPase